MPSNPHGLDRALSWGLALCLVVDSVGSYFCNQKSSSLTHIVGRLTLALVVGRPFRNVNYAFMPRPTTSMVVASYGKFFYVLPHAKPGHSTPPHRTAGGCSAPTAPVSARLPLAFLPLPRTPHRLQVMGLSITPSLTHGLKVPHGGPALGLSPQRPAHRAATSLRLSPGLRPPAPRVQRHVRCPLELCLPTPSLPHPSPSRGPVRSPVAFPASPAPERGPHQPLAAHPLSECRQPGELVGLTSDSSRGPSHLWPGVGPPLMCCAVHLGSLRPPLARRPLPHIGVTSQVPPPELLAARSSPGGQQSLDP